MYNRVMSWKVVLWVLLDVNPLHRFGLITKWNVLLKINLRITIILIMTMRYEGTLVSFWFRMTCGKIMHKSFGNTVT